jgi:hypothetical protein
MSSAPNSPARGKAGSRYFIAFQMPVGRRASARSFDPMKTNRKPFIILRKNCVFHGVGDRTYPVLSLVLLANRSGFLWLSKFFAMCARKNPDRNLWKNDPDPDDHEHLDAWCSPLDEILSDEMEIRVGNLTRKNRKQVYTKYGIKSSKPYKGDLKSQYEAQLRAVLPLWKRVLKMERDVRKGQTKRIPPARAKER